MRLDTHEEVGTSFADQEEMREAMVTIAKHVQDRGEQQHWAEHLRFLSPGRPGEDFQRRLFTLRSSHLDESDDGSDSVEDEESDSDEANSEFCSCNDFETEYVRFMRDELHYPIDSDSQLFRQPWRGRQVALTNPNDTPDCVHYVAASYCWNSTALSDYPSRQFTVLETNGVERAPSCPHSLLERVMQFAQWKQCQFIWIDQECINQSDPVDQSVGIQAMDLVYQRASFSLAVLEVVVREQRHLDALEQLYENSADMDDPTFARDLVDVLRVITSDAWFERAWCLQESTSGNRNMTLLIRCAEELEVPPYLESAVEGCFELDLSWLHNMISSLGGPLDEQKNVWSQDLQRDVREMMDSWYANIPPDASTEHDIESRTICNAAQALCHLERRQNSVVADRLAIMANLCGYEVRLDANALDKMGFGFSVCAMTLAVLNGDFSIQVGYEDFMRTGEDGRKSTLVPSMTKFEIAKMPFSWSLPLSASLNRLAYYDHDALPLRATIPISSLEHGLQVQGVLYVADGIIDLQDLATSFKNNSYLKPPGIVDLEVKINTHRTPAEGYHVQTTPGIRRVYFLLALLCKLYRQGYHSLVKLLWNQYRLRGTEAQSKQNEDIAKYVEAAFEEVIDVATGNIQWPNPISKFSPSHNHEATRTHPFSDLETARMDYTMYTVFKSGRLVVSRPIASPKENASYTGIFENIGPGTVVLAPRSNGLLKTPYHYTWYPSNWVVAKEADSWKCLRSVCGLWEGEEKFEEVVLLQ